MVGRYFWNILIALDQLLNTLFLGDPDETISSRAGKYAAQRRGWFPCALCRLLDKIDPHHCAKSIEADEGGRSIAYSK
jgi:hypothetical protein